MAALRLGLSVATVSIRMRGSAAGETTVELHDPTPARAGLEAQITALLAGRAGDILLGSGATSGAVSDLREATRLACAVHASFGLGATLLHRTGPETTKDLLARDPRLAALVEADLQRLMGKALALVEANRAVILALADRLLERRVLSGAEVLALVAASTGTPRQDRDSINPSSRRDHVDELSSREGTAI
ncbi:hypothetical protein [Microvirga massiliensis]|uniref:hypothetical protein n=1 Tax=Microvirga massiliensis TaxID=1033741 RepID=UPI000660C7E4|nr:hypothetical protein [Microvirga massiliensis]